MAPAQARWANWTTETTYPDGRQQFDGACYQIKSWAAFLAVRAARPGAERVGDRVVTRNTYDAGTAGEFTVVHTCWVSDRPEVPA